jgi:hypothetical protein
MNNPQQPREYDAVLGGNSPSLEGAAVLGGIEGVKLRLQNPDAKVRTAALEQALNYGKRGLDLLIECLKDEPIDIQNEAYINEVYRILYYQKWEWEENRENRVVKQALITFHQTRLRTLLANGQWTKADEETYYIMIIIANRTYNGWLDIKSIDDFSGEDLRTIDQLWVKYSNGRFGFSVQKRIYQSLGGTREYDQKIWEAFGDKVGWRREGSWSWSYHKEPSYFDITAPEAHLPRAFSKWTLGKSIVGSMYNDGHGRKGWIALLSHRDL